MVQTNSEGRVVVDREKYFRMLKSQGLDATLTALHEELKSLERETFEGRAGYRPQLFEDLKAFRNFSLELWNFRYERHDAGASAGSGTDGV